MTEAKKKSDREVGDVRDQLAAAFAAGPQWVMGMMSGTSLDGVDAALICTDGTHVAAFGAWRTFPYGDADRDAIARACTEAGRWGFAGDEPESFKAAEQAVTNAHAGAVRALLAGHSANAPIVIGFHGQTVFHRPPRAGRLGASRQLGDGDRLARAVSCPVMYDFRAADIAAGGHGAPLAPVYHAALASGRACPRAFVNIGGVANITWQGADGELIAFDCGPGNGPIDEWTQMHGRGRFDEDGVLARAGDIDEERLTSWLADPFFAEPPPKSLDRSAFPARLARGMSCEDGAASLTALSARAILAALERLPASARSVVVTGGGSHNPVLMGHLEAGLGSGRLVSAALLGIRADAVEAEAFAFLAARSLRSLPVSFPGTTGIGQPLTGGRFAAG